MLHEALVRRPEVQTLLWINRKPLTHALDGTNNEETTKPRRSKNQRRERGREGGREGEREKIKRFPASGMASRRALVHMPGTAGSSLAMHCFVQVTRFEDCSSDNQGRPRAEARANTRQCCRGPVCNIRSLSHPRPAHWHLPLLRRRRDDAARASWQMVAYLSGCCPGRFDQRLERGGPRSAQPAAATREKGREANESKRRCHVQEAAVQAQVDPEHRRQIHVGQKGDHEA